MKQKGERANRGCGWAECSSGWEGGREGAAVGEAGCEWSERKGERPPARPPAAGAGEGGDHLLGRPRQHSRLGATPPLIYKIKYNNYYYTYKKNLFYI